MLVKPHMRCYRSVFRFLLTKAPITIINSGERQRDQSQTSDAAKGSALLDKFVSYFLSALDSRLKKSKAAIIQILLVMTSTETESATIISSLQELKFGFNAVCSENDSDAADTKSSSFQTDVLGSSAEDKCRRVSRAQA
jgi:hypothetical protein